MQKAQLQRTTLCMLFIFTLFGNVFSQLESNLFLSSGNNQSSSGQYGKLALIEKYSHSDWNFEIGFSGILSNQRQRNFDALKLAFEKDFSKFKIGAFYYWTPYSTRLIEQNFGIVANRKKNKWNFDLGFNTQVISLTSKQFNSSNKEVRNLWQPFNLLYKITFEQQINEKFSFKASITDFDEFLIQQETNPFLITGFEYQNNEKMKIYLDFAYQQAGLMNIRVNYYGYYFKTGLKYNLENKENAKN